jgi:hypothetical protein
LDKDQSDYKKKQDEGKKDVQDDSRNVRRGLWDINEAEGRYGQ